MLTMAEKKYTLRIPDELHAQLEELARKDMRSLHKQILVILQEAAQKAQARHEGKRENKSEA